MTDLAAFLAARLAEDEQIARAASGSTVVGDIGRWEAAPTGDEWEAQSSGRDDEELLVALRTALPRPPDVMGGMWGALVSREVDGDGWSAMPVFEHAARHDPARVLAEIAAKRRILELYAWLQAEDRFPETGMQYGRMTQTKDILRWLAEPYSGHEDFDESWRT